MVKVSTQSKAIKKRQPKNPKLTKSVFQVQLKTRILAEILSAARAKGHLLSSVGNRLDASQIGDIRNPILVPLIQEILPKFVRSSALRSDRQRIIVIRLRLQC